MTAELTRLLHHADVQSSEFIPRAIYYFLRQDYEPKEPIIVDDGTDPIGDLVPQDDRIRYFRLNEQIRSEQSAIGRARPRAARSSRTGTTTTGTRRSACVIKSKRCSANMPTCAASIGCCFTM